MSDDVCGNVLLTTANAIDDGNVFCWNENGAEESIKEGTTYDLAWYRAVGVIIEDDLVTVKIMADPIGDLVDHPTQGRILIDTYASRPVILALNNDGNVITSDFDAEEWDWTAVSFR